jgi:UDP-N-acetylmuramyl pentapeptide phosphotransferase/UDP-N-acetylglucosamine-1-phosphate transferase
MRELKVAVLLVLVLAAMRATSWFLQWMLSRLARVPGGVGIVSGNLAALALFVGYLWWDRVPGEPMDRDAVLFGLVVFGLFGAADFFWRPRKRHRGAGPGREG